MTRELLVMSVCSSDSERAQWARLGIACQGLMCSNIKCVVLECDKCPGGSQPPVNTSVAALPSVFSSSFMGGDFLGICLPYSFDVGPSSQAFLTALDRDAPAHDEMLLHIQHQRMASVIAHCIQPQVAN